MREGCKEVTYPSIERVADHDILTGAAYCDGPPRRGVQMGDIRRDGLLQALYTADVGVRQNSPPPASSDSPLPNAMQRLGAIRQDPT